MGIINLPWKYIGYDHRTGSTFLSKQHGFDIIWMMVSECWELDWGKCPKIAEFVQVGERLIIIHPDVFGFRVSKTVSKVRMFIDGGLIEALTEWVFFWQMGEVHFE
jgi:hypothetical protein